MDAWPGSQIYITIVSFNLTTPLNDKLALLPIANWCQSLIASFPFPFPFVEVVEPVDPAESLEMYCRSCAYWSCSCVGAELVRDDPVTFFIKKKTPHPPGCIGGVNNMHVSINNR